MDGQDSNDSTGARGHTSVSGANDQKPYGRDEPMDSETREFLETLASELRANSSAHRKPTPTTTTTTTASSTASKTLSTAFDAAAGSTRTAATTTTTSISPPTKTTTASSSSSSSSSSSISPESLFPTTMSCREAFDSAFYCQSPGGQFINVYRYGTLRDCGAHWKAFWFCMRTKGYGKDERQRRIRDFYVAREAKYKLGPSSEDIWEARTEPVTDAFKGTDEDLRGRDVVGRYE